MPAPGHVSAPGAPARDAVANRAKLAALREIHGPVDWLTVVCGAMGAAYRLAGMTGPEFGALMRHEGLINIQERRKPLMRLRVGFDGGSGVIREKDGVVSMFFHFGRGTYSEEKQTVVVHGGVLSPEQGGGTPPCRFGALMPDSPRCISGAPVTAVTLLEWGATSVDVDLTWETLGPMPDEVAAGLGVGRQRHLGQIPWLDYEGPDPDAQG